MCAVYRSHYSKKGRKGKVWRYVVRTKGYPTICGSCDIDFDGALATLRASTTKTGKARSIALCPPMMEELRKLVSLRNQKKPFVFASKTAFGKFDFKKA